MSAKQPPLAPAATTVTAVVVAYASGSILSDCLRRLAADPAVQEIVLVDNGDGPASRLPADLPEPDGASLVTVSGHGNIGFAAGCNLGAARASGDLLLFSNPDCLWPLGAVTALRDGLQALPGDALLSPLLLNLDRSEQRGARRTVLTPWRALVEWLGLYRLAPRHPYFQDYSARLRQRFNRLEEPVPRTTVPVEVTSGAAMLLSKALFRTLGGFDERYFLHVEDIDLCVALLKQGGHAYLAPAVRVTHVGGCSRVHPLRIEWHKARGFAYYFAKHFAGTYPPGFVGLIRALVWLRFVFRLPTVLLKPATATPQELPARVSH